ncbi:hypothetical protein Bpfe_023163 [Biomphalaria pfeifferi]|uniref:Uncharacterized protein n=1 Tax=Biomphalaria pfeifferi TaxID=112525 RepID=A0AAD8B3M6_BIOPF|nr:hypothetical protein Bpfe_023163 [Biomphalaria pfeifferi]
MSDKLQGCSMFTLDCYVTTSGHSSQKSLVKYFETSGSSDNVSQAKWYVRPGCRQGCSKWLYILTTIVVVLLLLVVMLLSIGVNLQVRLDHFESELKSLRIGHRGLEEKVASQDNILLRFTSASDRSHLSYKIISHRPRRQANPKQKKRGDKKKPKVQKCCQNPCIPESNGSKLGQEAIDSYCQFTQKNNTAGDSGVCGGTFTSTTATIILQKVEYSYEVCKVTTIRYSHKYSPLHFYQKKANYSDKLIKMVNKTTFETVTSGSYLLHLNIVMIGEHNNLSVGIFVNSNAVLACPKGGLLLPYEPVKRYRLCSIDGAANVKTGDSIQIHTMEENMTVRLHQVSLFKRVLLHAT